MTEKTLNEQEDDNRTLGEIIRFQQTLPQPTLIGYLSGKYKKGKVPEGFLDKLEIVEKSQGGYLGSMGHHTCEYCFPGGDAQLHAKIASGEVGQDIWQEVTSSMEHTMHTKIYYYRWPDMLRHYIRVHRYQPPTRFIDAVLTYQPVNESERPKYEPIEIPDFKF